MLNNIKALVVILALALAVFYIVRPICLRFMSAPAFALRRNVWLALTVAAFLSPSFWPYAVFALLLLFWAGLRDENPLALYLVVAFTVPHASFQLPAVLINQLFDLSHFRILALAILLPAVVRTSRKPFDSDQLSSARTADVLLLAFIALQILLFIPYESLTNTMRRAFLFVLDAMLLLYAFNRLSDRAKISEAMACFWLACMLMAPMALFEWARSWLLYTGLVDTWGDRNAFAWLLRGGSLRAQVATGHSITLGYLLTVGLGFFLFLRSRVAHATLSWSVVLLLLAGIFVSGSRGAWVTAALLLFAFVLLRPDASRKLISAGVLGLGAVALMYVTPLKESVLDRLPFIGSADQGTIEYRQQVAETSWSLITQNPFFGDPFVYLRMEALRQGQGIIDIVNGYIFTALFSGLVGLVLEVSVYLFALVVGLRAVLRARHRDPDAGLLGAALVASLVASLAFVATAGWSFMMYVMVGCLISLTRTLNTAPAVGGSQPSFAGPSYSPRTVVGESWSR